jgi:hypothetical protein
MSNPSSSIRHGYEFYALSAFVRVYPRPILRIGFRRADGAGV